VSCGGAIRLAALGVDAEVGLFEAGGGEGDGEDEVEVEGGGGGGGGEG